MTQRPESYLHLDDERVYRALEELARRAVERDTTPAALAIAWLLGDERVTAVVLGPRRPEHLEAGIAALELRLSPDERAEVAGLF